MEKDLEGCGHWLIPGILLNVLRKTTKTSVRVAGVVTKIQTELFQNIILYLQHYPYV